MSNENKRKYNRVNNEFNVRLSKEDNSLGFKELNIDNDKAINISAAGLLVHIKEYVDIGKKIKIVFLQPNSFDFFEGNGEIVRVDKVDDESYYLAIHFKDLTPSDEKRLNYYLTLCD